MAQAPAPGVGSGLGSHVLGRYRLLLNLGQGGMGTIHLAIAQGTGGFQKLVVLKELRVERANDPAFVEMFLHEAKLAGQLTHPNVVQTIEATKIDGRLFLAMEFLEGQPLSQLMRSGQTPERLLLHVLCETLAGLHYAHELRDYGGHALNIVHCDVSPQNVFVTYDGHVKVVDFGIARAAGSSTETGFRGRLGYAAPEQLLCDSVDRRADLFAVGVMLWEALAERRLVVPGTADHDVVAARVTGAEPKIGTVVPDLHPRLAQICDQALQTDPARRFATAEEFRLALSQHLLALGKPLDVSEVGAFMSAKFHQQRTRLNNLIHEQLQDDESTFEVRTLAGEAESEISEFDVTRVADLSQLVELTRAGEDDGDLGAAFRPKPKRLWAVLSAAAAVGVGVTAWSTMRAGDTGPTPVIASSGSAVAQTPLANAPHPLVTAGDEQEQHADVDEEVGNVAEAAPSEERAAPSVHQPNTVSRHPSSRQPKPVGVAAEPAAGRVSAGAEAVRRTAPPTPPEQGASAPATALPSVTMGQDLSEIRKHNPRDIDEKNPFR